MKEIVGIMLYLFFGMGAVISGTKWLNHWHDTEEIEEEKKEQE